MKVKLIVKDENYIDYMLMICDRYNVEVLETQEPELVYLSGNFEDIKKFLQDLNERFVFQEAEDGTQVVARPLRTDSKKKLKLLKNKEIFGLKLYFISDKDNLRKLTPEVDKYSPNRTKRIPLYPSIQQCLQACHENTVDKEFCYIYVPKRTLLNHKIYRCAVGDEGKAYITNEYWCLDDLEVELLYKIKVGKDFFVPDFKYSSVFNYKITDVYEIDPDNILEELAILTETKYVKSEKNDIAYWLEFKNYKEARHFFKMCQKNLNVNQVMWVDKCVYYNF